MENKNETKTMATEKTDRLAFDSGYSEVNGLKMYYEIMDKVTRLFSFMVVALPKAEKLLSSNCKRTDGQVTETLTHRLNRTPTTLQRFSKI